MTQHTQRATKLGHVGLASKYGPADLMPHSHRHSEIELNYAHEGALTYLFGASEVVVEANRVALFWAALPHRLVHVAPQTTLTWITIPLDLFLGWQLPQDFSRLVLEGKTIVDTGQGGSRDGDLFQQWHDDLKTGLSVRQKIVLLEIEARLSRMALLLNNAQPTSGRADVAPQGEGLHKADQIAHFISARHSEQLSVAAIAAAVGLHPNYAMTIFRARHGVSMIDYLTQHRVAHAQRLLVTSDATVLEIALESGFNSLSRFYVAFSRICGQSPSAFRASLFGRR